MSELREILDKIKSDEVTGEQTLVIDQMLSAANAADIPNEDLAEVIDYIDATLLYNKADPEAESRMGSLRAALVARKQNVFRKN